MALSDYVHFPTAHIDAQPGDFAKTVLMPGDPLRAKFIADNYLEDTRLVNNVRGIQGYTGTFRGVPVSVMGSGMGIPSIGIYSYELYNIFGVENIIRVGSAGAISTDIHVRDILLGISACTDSAFVKQFNLPGTYAPTCDGLLLQHAVQISEALGIGWHCGSLLSTDTFYPDRQGTYDQWAKMGVMAVEMEAAGLYMTAARYHKRALAICTISDHLALHENTTAQERENTFTDMIELALNLAVDIDKL